MIAKSVYFIDPSRRQTYIKNLSTLAMYLNSLPKDYDKFDMGTFNRGGDDESLRPIIEGKTTEKHTCQTAACAVGHAPFAGIRVKENCWMDLTFGRHFDWNEYSEHAFGLESDSEEWKWLFGGEWEHTDDTVRGAARRIELLLNGYAPPADIEDLLEDEMIPEDYLEQIENTGSFKID